MEIKELQEFAKKDNERLRKRNKTSDKESILTNVIKLSEETGEVSNEILKYFNYQRKEKMNNNQIAEEIADVIMVASILAESMEINLESALKEKMRKVDSRYRE